MLPLAKVALIVLVAASFGYAFLLVAMRGLRVLALRMNRPMKPRPDATPVRFATLRPAVSPNSEHHKAA